MGNSEKCRHSVICSILWDRLLPGVDWNTFEWLKEVIIQWMSHYFFLRAQRGLDECLSALLHGFKLEQWFPWGRFFLLHICICRHLASGLNHHAPASYHPSGSILSGVHTSLCLLKSMWHTRAHTQWNKTHTCYIFYNAAARHSLFAPAAAMQRSPCNEVIMEIRSYSKWGVVLPLFYNHLTRSLRRH